MAARIREGRLDRVAGGRGWLLGDAGGGFWIGHAVARAVVASLDGQGQGTALTGLVLEVMRIEADTAHPQAVQKRAATGLGPLCPAANLVGRIRATCLRGP